MPKPQDALDAVPGIVHRVTRSLRVRVNSLIARAVVTAIKETSMIRAVQFERMAGSADEAEHFEPHGFTGRPKTGAEAIVLYVGGCADHPIALVVSDRRYRPTDLDEGEACLYSADGAQVRAEASKVKIVPPAAGTIEVGAGGHEAARKTDEVTANADVITWAGEVQALLAFLQPIHGGAPAIPTPPAAYKGTITSGSATVTEAD